ncbi:MAG: two-component sensor histidine kinase [Proteobacteria bacterium]|nr:two-component sensor histidine kinase [Pseudomonadota bacterium]
MEKDRYATMRRLILASMIVVPLILFIVIMGIGYYYFTMSIETSTISSMKRIVEDHRHMIDSFLSEREADLEFILRSYRYEELTDTENLARVFERLQKKSNAFVDLGVFNEKGIHVAYQGPFRLTGKAYQDADWFKEVVKKGYYISDIFLGYRRIPHFVIALMREDNGKKWVIRATIDTYMFNDMVKKVHIGKTGEAYILNADGIFQTERRSGGSLLDKDPDSVEYPTQHSGTETFIKKDARGDKYLYATTWLKDKRWFLIVRQEKADAFKSLRSAGYLIALITVIGGAALVGIAFYETGRIVRRMERIDTEKEELGQQLVRASRLAEIGEMATGIAHEINNPLQVMKSEQTLVDAILSDLKEKGEIKESEDLKEIEDSMAQIKLQIDRCSKITHAVLKFGRESEVVSTDIDLGSFIPDIVSMVENKASVEGITVTQEISEDIPPIQGDPGQLQQVLINLFNNAIDAIVERHGSEGGELDIGAGLKKDGKVQISVRDNGVGISPENLKKVFSPFFTTKPVGKGTGLGLSVCYGIIDSMGGVMEVSSQKGAGTTFTIDLPAVT